MTESIKKVLADLVVAESWEMMAKRSNAHARTAPAAARHDASLNGGYRSVTRTNA
jgi:hypothetical protein